MKIIISKQHNKNVTAETLEFNTSSVWWVCYFPQINWPDESHILLCYYETLLCGLVRKGFLGRWLGFNDMGINFYSKDLVNLKCPLADYCVCK
jgi:hypothetical protein